MTLRRTSWARPVLAAAGLLGAALLSHCGASAAKVGAACARDSDCSGGASALCLTGDGVYAGGYCSRFCDTDTDCGEGAFCEAATGNGVCVATCSAEADCRTAEGYHCDPAGLDAGMKGCLPRHPDAGTADGG